MVFEAADAVDADEAEDAKTADAAKDKANDPTINQR